jgi:molecular chaperone IbpA
MRSLTTFNNHLDDIFRDLNRFAVGFEPTIRMLDQVRNTSSGGYPPYDLEQIDDTSYRLSMAVAGFTADDIDIMLHDGVLTIEGKVKQEDTKTYLHRGIAGRSFRRTFYLAAWIKVTGSNLADGILTIDFSQEIPEAMKPRKIVIGNSPVARAIESKPSA